MKAMFPSVAQTVIVAIEPYAAGSPVINQFGPGATSQETSDDPPETAAFQSSQ